MSKLSENEANEANLNDKWIDGIIKTNKPTTNNSNNTPKIDGDDEINRKNFSPIHHLSHFNFLLLFISFICFLSESEESSEILLYVCIYELNSIDNFSFGTWTKYRNWAKQQICQTAKIQKYT